MMFSVIQRPAEKAAEALRPQIRNNLTQLLDEKEKSFICRHNLVLLKRALGGRVVERLTRYQYQFTFDYSWSLKWSVCFRTGQVKVGGEPVALGGLSELEARAFLLGLYDTIETSINRL